jgi:hypothetical protein
MASSTSLIRLDRGVAWPVGEEDAIGLREAGQQGRVPGKEGHLAVALQERADDVHLDAAVDGEHLPAIALAVHLGRGDGHLRHQVALVDVDELLFLVAAQHD